MLVTRPESQGEQLAEQIRTLGGTALVWPLLEIESLELPRDEAAIIANRSYFTDVKSYDAIFFVSANARDTYNRRGRVGRSPSADVIRPA